MNPESQEVERLFRAARELAKQEQRAAFLQIACEGNAQLCRAVEALLQAEELVSTAPEASSAADPVVAAPSAEGLTTLAEKPGDRIGRYRLLQQIGEGGCGVVYMAEQEEPVRRRVALKVIKLGMDTRQVVGRFEAERQALALMDHPSIAKVLDAGATATGRPYFVMELVKGIRITDYCDQNNLSTQERLTLFRQVCHAVQHAHQKGIIHRDIKPSNILVTSQDGLPVPKVIDFGIAKATTDQRLTSKTVFTAFQQFIGTPAYMSPEQAEMSGLDVDTRTDIYSLGVLLYELLTGRTPFDPHALLQAGLDQMRRIIREQEPERPSSRLSTLAASDLTKVASRRRTEPPRLVNLIRGDLDWIVMKALEKDRTRRYATAEGFSADVQRHLTYEPVLARPTSPLYRFQKLIRRNKLAVSAAAACAVVLALFAGEATRQARLARSAARLAEGKSDDEVRQRKIAEQAVLRAQAAASNELVMRMEAELQRRRAESETSNALALKIEAERQSRNSEARRLLAEATYRVEEHPEQALLLLVEAMNLHQRQGEDPLVVVEEQLAGALGKVDGFALRGQSPAFQCLAASPDAHWVIAGGWDGNLTLWNLNSPDIRRSAQVVGAATNPITVVAISPDGRCLACGASDGTLKIWGFESNGLLRLADARSGDGKGINAILFDRHGKALAAAGDDGSLVLWDMRGDDPPTSRSSLHFQHGPLSALAMTPDAEALLLGFGDGALGILKLHPPYDAQRTIFFTNHLGAINALSIGPEGRQVATASEDGTARVWDLHPDGTATCQRVLRGHEYGVSAVILIPRNGLVTGGSDGTVRVWDLTSSKNDAASAAVPAHEKGLVLTVPGTAAGSTNSPMSRTSFKLSDLKYSASKQRELLNYQRKVSTLESFLMASLPMRPPPPPQNLRIVDDADAQDNKVPSRTIVFGGVTGMVMSPGGRFLVTAGSDGIAKVWELQGHTNLVCLKTLRGHEAWLNALSPVPSSGLLASASWDGTVRVWPTLDSGVSPRALHASFDRLDQVIRKVPILARHDRERSDDKQLAQALIDLARDRTARNLTGDEWNKFFPGQPYRKVFEDLPAAP